MNHKEHKIKEELVDTAKKTLNKSINYIVGCRKIDSLLRMIIGEYYSDDELSIFDLIDSETDHLPVGKFRKQWNKEALAMKDKEAERIYKLYEKDILNGLEAIVKNYK